MKTLVSTLALALSATGAFADGISGFDVLQPDGIAGAENDTLVWHARTLHEHSEGRHRRLRSPGVQTVSDPEDRFSQRSGCRPNTAQ